VEQKGYNAGQSTAVRRAIVDKAQEDLFHPHLYQSDLPESIFE